MGTSSTKAKNKYNKKAYKQINLQIKPSIASILDKHCKCFSYTRSGFIIQAIKEKIERDTGKKFNEFLNESQDKTDNGFSDGSQVNQPKSGTEENP